MNNLATKIKRLNAQELCETLIQCESETEVIDILKQQDLWNEEHWRLYGDQAGNYSTIGNQASLPEVALVEKLINSVDHVLIGECVAKGINPKSEDAPRSMPAAVEKFFGVKDGRIINVSPGERAKLAERIKLVATGDKRQPCFTVIDAGEGQHPAKFPETLLSLVKDNKFDIPFVQGTFNMGSTGVLRYCGEHKIQLIVSRRKPSLLKEGQDDLWGFTVVRRESAKENEKRSKFTFLAPGGTVISFKADFLMAAPGKYPDPYGERMIHGTFVKMYNYDIGPYKTNILFDLYNRLSLLTPSIALPIRLYERRSGYKGHSFETTMAGLMTRVEEDRNENLEEGFPCSLGLNIDGHKFNATIFAFKKDRKANYSKSEGVIFSVNGQVQGDLPSAFFARKAVNMAYLKDSLLVHMDCSHLDTLTRENLFMNSRDRLTDSEFKKKIEKNLETKIKDHEGLRELREKRRREEIEDRLSDSKPLEDILNSLISKAPTLSKLFISGQRISNPFKQDKGKTKTQIKLKKYPDYFDLVKEFPKDKPKVCAVNRGFRIQFKTNADNDYFARDDFPGEYKLYANGQEIPNYAFNLWNGTATLNAALPLEVKVGDVVEYRVEISDVNRADPFEHTFNVLVGIAQQSTSKGGGNSNRKNNPGEEDGEGNEPDGFAMPNIIEVTKDEFEKYGFDEEDALAVKPDGHESFDFFVNVDNKFLLSEMASSDSSEAKILKAQFTYGLVILGMAVLREDDEKPEKIREITRAIGPVFLPLISSLGEIEAE